MKNIPIKITAIFILIASFTGCALIGSDVRGLRDIKEAHTRVFDKDLPYCYDLTIKALSRWKASAFQRRKNDYIVAMELETVFRSCIDTTELGLFFTETGPNKTEVKVTSLNYNLSEAVAQKLFDYIEKDGKVPIEKETAPNKPVSLKALY